MKTAVVHYLLKEFWNSVTLCGLPLFYLLFILILFQFSPLQHTETALIMFVALELFCFLLKVMIPKKRPETTIKRIYVTLYHERSFPSVHTARISLLAIIVLTLFPTNLFLTSLFLLLVIFVGYSRVFLREHDFVDISGGVFVGILFGMIWRMF